MALACVGGLRSAQRVEKSAVQDMFGGMYRSSVTCDTCHHESTVYEPFLNLSLSVPEKEVCRPCE